MHRKPSLEELQTLVLSLEERVRHHEKEIATLRDSARGEARRDASAPEHNGRRRVSRSDLLRAAGASTALVAAGVLQVAAPATSASAATGKPVLAGEATVAEAGTSVGYDGTTTFDGVILLGNDTEFSNNGATYPAAAGGWAGGGSAGVATGVYGYTSDGTGYGVVGNAEVSSGFASGVGVMGTCATGIGVLGQFTESQSPPAGTNSAVYGTGAAATRTEALGRIGVQGVSDTSSGVLGNSGSGNGIRGISISSIGVYGISSTSAGVEGASASSFGGVFASTAGTGLIGEQTFTLKANNPNTCLHAVRNGTNSSGNAFNYSGALIYGHDNPSSSGGGSTPQSTGPLLQLDKNGSTKLKVDGSGNLTLGGNLTVTPTTAATATGGSVVPPAHVAGYLVISIGGTKYKLPYFNI